MIRYIKQQRIKSEIRVKILTDNRLGPKTQISPPCKKYHNAGILLSVPWPDDKRFQTPLLIPVWKFIWALRELIASSPWNEILEGYKLIKIAFIKKTNNNKRIREMGSLKSFLIESGGETILYKKKIEVIQIKLLNKP